MTTKAPKGRKMRARKAWVILIHGQLVRPSLLECYDTKRDAWFDKIDGSDETIVQVEIRPVRKAGRK